MRRVERLTAGAAPRSLTRSAACARNASRMNIPGSALKRTRRFAVCTAYEACASHGEQQGSGMSARAAERVAIVNSQVRGGARREVPGSMPMFFIERQEADSRR